MLSYQHAYHAGNLADMHKHVTLAWMLGYLTRKDKPLSYIETHAGRGLYDLDSAEAQRTGEAARGIERPVHWALPDHAFARALAKTRDAHGHRAYPGSPLVAAQLLRPDDTIHLAELHRTEFDHLRGAMRGTGAHLHRRDGAELALSVCPPTPRRGLLLVDPPYEIKTDYTFWPRLLRQIHAKWNVGVLCLWYPILAKGDEAPIRGAIAQDLSDALVHEVRFDPARKRHGMIGSGLCVVNPPYGLEDELARLTDLFDSLKS